MKGQAEVFPKPGKSFDPMLIPKAIKNAGFSVPEVLVTVDGTLGRKKEFLELEVPGLTHPFVLAGGAQEPALKNRAEFSGKRLRVTGKLNPSSADLPPRLTVESFQAVP